MDLDTLPALPMVSEVNEIMPAEQLDYYMHVFNRQTVFTIKNAKSGALINIKKTYFVSF